MNPIQFSSEEKIRHLLQWADAWNDDSRGESAWSYSLKLGGSHALLNGWIKNAELMSSLTGEERDLISKAREKSSTSRKREKFQKKRLPVRGEGVSTTAIQAEPFRWKAH